MFERHFGLRENPFQSGHQMRFLYPSREHQEARAHLRYGIENREPFVLITGEVGTGKTTALYDALAEWGASVNVALITNSSLTRQELLEEICLRFGLPLPPGTSKPQALAQLERHLLAVRERGDHAVLLLDEAQNLAAELLEEIRLLSNLETMGERLIQIILVGQPELEARLADPRLRQLRQRITVHYRLNPLSPEETAGYIHHRLSVAGGNAWTVFPPESCREVYRVTHGIPREINTVASQALLTAFTEGAGTVQSHHVQAVAHESEFRSVLGEPASELFAPETAASPPVAPAATPAPPAPPAPLAPPSSAGANPLAHAFQPPDPPAGAVTPVGSTPPPAWTPPPLERERAPEPPRAEPPDAAPSERIELTELDAWAAAARDLSEARRRTPAGEPPAAAAASRPETPEMRVAPPLPAAPLREVPPVHREPPASRPREGAGDSPRFPTPAELYARGASARPDRSDLSGLPPRLREKIARDIERDEQRNPALPIAIGLMTVAALVVGLLVWQRVHRAHDATVRANATADSITRSAAQREPPLGAAALTHSDTSRVARRAHADSLRRLPVEAPPVTSAPKSEPAKQQPKSPTPTADATPAGGSVDAKGSADASSGTAAKAATNKAASTDSLVFCVGVSSFIEKTQAEVERDRVAVLTGLPGRVVPYRDGANTMYRVVVGTYPSNGAAEKAATSLMAQYGLAEAQPLLLDRIKPSR